MRFGFDTFIEAVSLTHLGIVFVLGIVAQEKGFNKQLVVFVEFEGKLIGIVQSSVA